MFTFRFIFVLSLLPHPSHDMPFLFVLLFRHFCFLLAWFSSMKMNVLHASTCCSPNSLTTWTNATNLQFSSFIWVAPARSLLPMAHFWSLAYTMHTIFVSFFLFCCKLLFYVLGLAAVIRGCECSVVELRVPIFVCASSVFYCVFICFNKSLLFIEGYR